MSEMDEQHITLFALFNDVCAALEEGCARQVVEPLLCTFFDCTRKHFSSEEAVLRAAGFPGLSDHADHHRDLDTLLREYMRRFERGELGSSANLLNFLRHWLIRHVQVEDKNYGSWLRAHDFH